MKELNRELRSRMKEKAREQIHAKFLQVLGIQVLALVIILLPTLLVYGYFFYQILTDVFEVQRQSMDSELELTIALLRSMGALSLFSLLWVIVITLLSGVLGLGEMKYFIDLAKGRETSVRNLFYGFRKGNFWISLRMGICLAFRGFLWMLVPNAIYYAVYLKNMLTTGNTPGISVYLAYYLITFLISIKLMTYNAGWIEILEHKNHRAWEATRLGTALFRGYMYDFFLFALSFWPWLLVILCACMIGVMLIVIASAANGLALFAIVLTAVVLLWIALDFYLGAYIQVAFLHFCFFLQGEEAEEEPKAFFPEIKMEREE